MNDFDWNQVRGFVATAQAGSLSAAARELGLTQPTLSRQVAALEAKLGVTLFERAGKALILTETGLDLLAHAKQMRGAADAMGLAASGRVEAISGLVSISASDGIATHMLAPILARLRLDAPQIRIEIIASNSLSDLRRREADIAIRHVRPEEPELIAKLARNAAAYFYASNAWVAENGMLESVDDLRGKDFIGFDREEVYVGYLKNIGLPVEDMHFPLLSDNSTVTWELVKAGLGIGVMMEDIGERTPDVMRVLADLPPIMFPIWIVTHRELHTSKPIRIVFDALSKAFSAKD